VIEIITVVLHAQAPHEPSVRLAVRIITRPPACDCDPTPGDRTRRNARCRVGPSRSRSRPGAYASQPGAGDRDVGHGLATTRERLHPDR
jgi:hypothetical protein